ncbi:hypothetical protein [Sinomonas atrocyanea]
MTSTLTEGRNLQATLDREAAAAMAIAERYGQGLVVTRHDGHAFTVESSPDVAAGTVEERDLLA